MIQFSELTKEMVDNTKSFYEHCREKQLEKLLEDHRNLFDWFYDPNFISDKPLYSEHLTEYEIGVIIKAVEDTFEDFIGYKRMDDWFSINPIITNIKKEVRFIKTLESKENEI